MINTTVKRKDADIIIKALEGGVVPESGIGHLLVGRIKEVHEVIDVLKYVKEGNSDIRFWVGDYGSGKSFMLRTIENLALADNFVVSTADLTPVRRFHATDGKSRALYREVMDNLKTKTSKNKNALSVILEEWFQSLIDSIPSDKKDDLTSKENLDYIKNKILDVTENFSSTGLILEFSQALFKYYTGLVTNDRILKLNALRYITGDITTRTESKSLLGINRNIDDDNWYDVIKNLAELFKNIGYSGFVINFDETVNLYKLPLARTRERNYERVLNIYNEAKTNKSKGLFINFGSTRKTVFDENRGMSSYGALKGRLGNEKDMDSKLDNVSRTVLPLKPLSNEEIFTLLENLVSIFNVHLNSDLEVSEKEIHSFMEEELNRPGAMEFLTPRAVIKDFLEILETMKNNEGISFSEILNTKFNLSKKKVVNESSDDDIEIL